MALPQPSLTFVGFAIILGYLSTFVLFAFVRIITGVSIQRLGWASFRRISFSPKDGIKVEIRGLGWALHRPTFAQPTWVSIVLEELKVTVDLRALGTKKSKAGRWSRWTNGSVDFRTEEKHSPDSPPATPRSTPGKEQHGPRQRSRAWEQLTDIKERVKRLHRMIQWIRLVDLVAKDTTFAIADVGAVQIALYTMAVDTRAKTVDRSRLFQHRRAQSASQRPAEWIVLIRSVLFLPDGKDSTEILDNCLLNVHGLLVPDLDGLRDVSVSLKLGRVNLPYDDVLRSVEQTRTMRHHPKESDLGASDTEASFGDYMEEFDNPGSKEETIVQTVSDSKEFLSSILRGIQEVQFAISFFGMTQRIRDVKPEGNPVYLNMSMKEVGLDLLRLDQKSPAHLMYFSSDDVAHQALLTAISISFGIDDGHEHPERLLYIPMATATIRTTLPSKTIQLARERNVAERNANILYANLVVTSPSVDLDPKHLPLMLAIMQSRRGRQNRDRKRGVRARHSLVSRLLPKATIKTSVHEPVIRVSLPPMEKEKKGTGEFDLLISAMSSMSLDIESSHNAGGDLHYALASSLRINNHNLYYQTASSEKFNLLITESAEIKVQVSASPDVAVIASANLQTFSVFMVRPEISEGVRQIVKQLRHGSMLRPRRSSTTSHQNFLRKMPSWLQHVSLNGQDFNIEIAGIDAKVSKEARGTALHLESWNAEYRADKTEFTEIRQTRRAASKSVSRRGDDSPRASSPASPIGSPGSANSRRLASATDGRRLAVHTQGLEVYVVESAETWEPEPFLAMPRFEVAFTTSSDKQGPIFHINAFAKSLTLNYSLYRHFAVGMAALVVRRTFDSKRSKSDASPQPIPSNQYLDPATPIDARLDKPEIITVDFRSSFIQLKTEMPADPPMMLQLFGLEAGQHRWARPFARAKLVRVYAESPSIKKVWSRLMSFRTVRFDYRMSRRNTGKTFVEERSFDISMDATRVAIPHQLVFHKITENIVNVKKTVEQLHHRFKTKTDEYILEKHPEGPKHVPRISVRSSAFLFEIEDGSFDWKLGCIFRAGLEEQKQRLAREEAFRLKVKRLMESGKAKGGSVKRTRSATPARARSPRARIRRKNREHEEMRSQSADPPDRGRDPSPRSPRSPRSPKHGHRIGLPHLHHNDRRGRRMHYDTSGKCTVTDNSQTSIDAAWEQLLRLNAQSWKRRIDHVLRFQNKGMQSIRSSFGILDDVPEDVEQPETIMAIPQRPALMSIEISDLNILIDKPSFPVNEYPTFLHRIGKGMPYDMKYGLLIPVSVVLGMGEARVSLRDYPLPILHVPALAYGQSHKFPSFQLKTDFVIAEEFRDGESIRHINIPVVPPDTDEVADQGLGYAVDVQRTISSIKTYSDMSININTSNPTKITWGASYQPAIQDTMQVVESFTKPPMDPSERVGFWDKIRLTFHSRVKVSWAGDGDIHLILKGTRDPYDIIGDGAGFVMCWRKNVVWSICQDPDPKNFITVDSQEYVLAIPDANFYVKNALKSDASDSVSSISSGSSGPGDKMFHKTVMKLHGNVRWSSGLVFERNTDNGGRSTKFIPHWDVVLKNPKHAKAINGKPYDAFRGFRSHHIHMSVGIASPLNREWTVSNLKPAAHYNSVHLTPRFFSHFFSWWSMFSGVMSLPVHQGKLWPGPEKSSKKFGRHLATIKYSLLLSPLYMSHVYKHKEAEEMASGSTHATGLKLKLDSFMLDLHQRRELIRTPVKGSNTKMSKVSAIKINQAQLDFIAADIRAISATFERSSNSNLDQAAEETMLAYQRNTNPKLDLTKFTIPDEDVHWIDMDDFVELDDMLPAESSPEVKILPLAFAPRFTYFRQTDHGDTIAGDPFRTSPFGHEDTHYCVMTTRNDPRLVQSRLIGERLKQIDRQIEHNARVIGKLELEVVKASDNKAEVQQQCDTVKHHGEILRRKKEFLENMLQTIQARLRTGDRRAVPDHNEEERFYEAKEEYDISDEDPQHIDAAPFTDYLSDFNNRFVIHNMQFKWTNSLRNIILRYIHQVSQRRGFVYYMSRSSVKFILDIIEEQKKGKTQSTTVPIDPERRASVVSPGVDDCVEVQDRIEQLLKDAKKFVQADDPTTKGSEPGDASSQNISHDFAAQNSYHVRLVAPQIQLQSEKNTKNAILLTAKGMSLKIIQIMDKDRIFDDVSGLVQRRFFGSMDNLQVFASTQDSFNKLDTHMYSGNRYGAPKGSHWPPWVPLEVMFDFNVDPFGFTRVVQRTSASLRYDKYNTLRLKYNDDVSKDRSAKGRTADSLEERIDHLWVEFPQVRAICDSNQYYALYVIVLDLLLYSEPLEKTRNERLERIMLASDFSDLTNVPDLVIRLQDRIRQMEELKMHFQLQEKGLDSQGWRERLVLEHDLTACEDELFFTMKAITSSQRRYDDRAQEQSTGLLRWYISASELVWHLIRGENESLVELQLKGAHYDRTDNTDGSNQNIMQVERIRGLNLLPDAIYPEIIAPFVEDKVAFHNDHEIKMLRVQWLMLEAIAGIPVMDHFEINLFPLRLQLEREAGEKLFEYVFPGSDSDESSGEQGFSPFMLKHSLPSADEDESDRNGTNARGHTPSMASETSSPNGDTQDDDDLELRLQPTLTLREPHKPKTVGFMSRFNQSRSQVDLPAMRKDGVDMRKSVLRRDHSSEALSVRPQAHRSVSNFSSTQKRSTEADRARRFSVSRQASEEKSKKERSDDLSQMLYRASNFMTLSYVKIPSVVLCLSYKGKGHRNLEDVHNLVFRMPTLEYRNKTWSNYDLFMQLKKEVIKALLQHVGTIIGNKFSHHRPTKQQQSRLRELANSSTLLGSSTPSQIASELPSTTTSETNSMRDYSPSGFETSPDRPRKSFASNGGGSDLSREMSNVSSASEANGLGLIMTPHRKRNGSIKSATKASGTAPEVPEVVVDAASDHTASRTQSIRRHFTLRHNNGDQEEEGDEAESSSVRRKSRLLPKRLITSLTSKHDTS